MTTTTEPLRPLTADDLDDRLCPDVDLPICSSEHGSWFGYGHIDPEAFVQAVNTISRYLGLSSTPEEDWKAADVTHRWVTTTGVPEESDGQWGCQWAQQTDPGAWPITCVLV